MRQIIPVLVYCPPKWSPSSYVLEDEGQMGNEAQLKRYLDNVLKFRRKKPVTGLQTILVSL